MTRAVLHPHIFRFGLRHASHILDACHSSGQSPFNHIYPLGITLSTTTMYLVWLGELSSPMSGPDMSLPSLIPLITLRHSTLVEGHFGNTFPALTLITRVTTKTIIWVHSTLLTPPLDGGHGGYYQVLVFNPSPPLLLRL